MEFTLLFGLAVSSAGLLVFGLRVGLFHPLVFFALNLIFGILFRYVYLQVSNSLDGSFFEVLASHSEPEFVSILGDLLLAVSAIVIGYFLVSQKRVLLADNRIIKCFSPEVDELRPLILMAIATLFGSVFLWGLWTVFGSLQEGFDVLQRRAVLYGSEVFLIRTVLVGMNVAVCLLLVTKLSTSGGIASWSNLLLLALAGWNLSLLFLIGGRGAVIIQLAALLFIYITIAKPSAKVRWILLSGATAIFVVVVVGGLLLRLQQQGADDASDVSVDTVLLALSGSFPILDLYAAAKVYGDAMGFDYGLQFVLYLFRFVPRDMWPEKPNIIGMQIRDYYEGHTLSGVPPTIFGEFYIAGGQIGLIVGGAIFGVFIALLSALYREAQRNYRYVVLYIYLMIELIVEAVRSGLEIGIFSTAYVMAFLLFIRIICGVFDYFLKFIWFKWESGK